MKKILKALKMYIFLGVNKLYNENVLKAENFFFTEDIQR